MLNLYIDIFEMLKIIPFFTAILVISFFVFVFLQISKQAHKKKTVSYYEIMIINLILIFQLTNLYRLLIKTEIAENIKTTEIIHRKPGF